MHFIRGALRQFTSFKFAILQFPTNDKLIVARNCWFSKFAQSRYYNQNHPQIIVFDEIGSIMLKLITLLGLFMAFWRFARPPLESIESKENSVKASIQFHICESERRQTSATKQREISAQVTPIKTCAFL